MKRYGQVIALRPEAEAEYIRYHAAVWPAVLKTIAECNMRIVVYLHMLKH